MVRVRFCCSHMLNRELLFFQLSHFPLLWKQVDRCQLKHNLTCTDIAYWSKVTFTNWYEQYCLFIREANSWGLIVTLPGPTINPTGYFEFAANKLHTFLYFPRPKGKKMHVFFFVCTNQKYLPFVDNTGAMKAVMTNLWCLIIYLLYNKNSRQVS